MATDEDIQLSDMLESYPPSLNPGFQTLLTAKKEFSELASDPREHLPPGKGQYFKHQKFTHRFLRAYDDLLDFSATGTGKSCNIFGFTEYAHRELEKAKVDPLLADEKSAHFKKVVILVKGPTQKNELRNQLICRCSDGHYETGIVKRAKKEKVQKTNLTRELKNAGYTITTYISFAHRINENPRYENTPEGDANLAEDYSDTIFWVDEAHNIAIDRAVDTTKKTKKYREKEITYKTIRRVFQHTNRCKRIISTATPMINDVSELSSLMNLILPVDGVLPSGYDYRNAPPNDIRVLFPGLPFDYRTATPEQMAFYFRGQMPEGYDFNNATLEDLEPYMRGRIGYVRASDTGAIPEEQGIQQQNIYDFRGVVYQSQLVIYATEMSEHQSFGTPDGGHGYAEARLIADEVEGPARQASNFVFPDGYWGNGNTEEEKVARQEAKAAKKAAKAAARAALTRGEEVQPVAREALPIGGLVPIGTRMEPIAGEEELEIGAETGGFERRAFRRYVRVRGDAFFATQEFAPWLQDLRFIWTLSCKYAEIVRLVTGEPGNCFVYGEFVEGSGAIVLALCLEGMGFVRYNEVTSMFQGVGGDVVKPVCAGSNEDAANRRVRIPSRQEGAPPRYVLLAGDQTSPAKFHSMMEAMNSYENRHGDYIKVFISSRVGRDGINVNNVLQIHLIGSEWNQSAQYQALSRGVRATSHNDLLAEERERIVAERGDLDLAYTLRRIIKELQVQLSQPELDQIEAYVNQARLTYQGNNQAEMDAYVEAEAVRIRRAIVDARYIFTPEEEESIRNAIGDPAAARQLVRDIVLSRHPEIITGNITDPDLLSDIVESRYLLSHEEKAQVVGNPTLIHNFINLHLIETDDWANTDEHLRNVIIDAIYQLSPEEEAEIMRENGDPDMARISIKVYKHAAVSLDEEGSSIDLRMYRLSEGKDHGIRRIMRIMKQCAIGCQVHYNRNVRPGDIDGSPTCDYDDCRYQCVDPAPIMEDYSTYDVLYAGEVVSDAIEGITNIYRQRNALTLNELVAYLPEYRRKYLIMALEQLITNKVPLTDRFGYTTYLREDHGSFYLDRTYPTGVSPSYAMSYYTQGVIGIEQENLANIVVKLEAGEHQEVLAELEVMDPKDPQFNIRLEAISIEGQATILETVIIRVLEGNRSDFTDAIITKFQRMIFPIKEPTTELNKVYDQLALHRPRRGRKPNPETKRRIKKINPITIEETKITRDEDTELVYLHTLYSQVINQTKYAATARFNKGEGRTRLLKPSEIEDGWRDLSEIELPVYNALIQVEIATRNQPFEEQGIYGFVLPGGEFRIRDRLTEAAGAATDARKIKRGRVCDTWFRSDLIDVCYNVGVAAPGGHFPDYTEENRLQLIQNLLQRRVNKTYDELATWPLDRLVYYFKWYQATKVTRKTICEVIKHRMGETGRLIE